MESKMLSELRKPGYRDRYVDEHGPVVCMTVKNGYVMVRRPYKEPFVISLAEWHERAGTKPTEKVPHPHDTLMLRAFAQCGELTNRDLQAKLGLKERTVRERLRRFRASKAIHVCRWIAPEATGKHTPVFALGNEKDAPVPIIGRKQTKRNYRKKMRLVINAKARKTPPNPFQQLLTQ
jgi:hypothetical protein